MKKTLLRSATIAAMLLAASVVGGCDSSAPEGEPTMANDGSGDVAPGTAAPDTSSAANTESAAALVPAPNASAGDDKPEAAPVDPDAQTLDDADATGMTARVSRDAATTNEAANQ